MAAPTLNPYITVVKTVTATTATALDTAIATAIAAGLAKNTPEYAVSIDHNISRAPGAVVYSAVISFTTAAS
jgi:hypothetical protein